MAERVPRGRRAMTEQEKAVIRDGWNIHRKNYVRILAYVRRHIPDNVRGVYEGRNDTALRRRIRDYVQKELQDAVEEREREMRHVGPAAPWRADQQERGQLPDLNAAMERHPPPSILTPGDDEGEADEEDNLPEPGRPQPQPDVPARRREPLWALARRNQERFSDMLDAHEARMERVDRILDAIEENL